MFSRITHWCHRVRIYDFQRVGGWLYCPTSKVLFIHVAAFSKPESGVYHLNPCGNTATEFGWWGQWGPEHAVTMFANHATTLERTLYKLICKKGLRLDARIKLFLTDHLFCFNEKKKVHLSYWITSKASLICKRFSCNMVGNMEKQEQKAESSSIENFNTAPAKKLWWVLRVHHPTLV